jgi:DNA topoisomerase IB
VTARQKLGPVELTANPKQAAKEAGLRYVTDKEPGLARKRNGRSFRYLDVHGKPLRDPDTIGRIRSLVIPPAWKEVWICSSANGHLQATGRDARGRKQSRYHPHWREVRDETKYERMLSFGGLACNPRPRGPGYGPSRTSTDQGIGYYRSLDGPLLSESEMRNMPGPIIPTD